jgi:hypothetical protein
MDSPTQNALPAENEESRRPLLAAPADAPREPITPRAASKIASWSSARTYDQNPRREAQRKLGFHSLG